MAEDDEWQGSSAWLFLLGLVVFLGSGLLFVVDLVRGLDVLRGIVGNGVGVALLITWAAHDTLRNPDSAVGTPAGAAGTALLLYGLYLLAAGAVITLTGLVHEHTTLGFWYVGLAVVAVIAGFFIFPTDEIVENDEDTDNDTTDCDERSSDETAAGTPESRAENDR